MSQMPSTSPHNRSPAVAPDALDDAERAVLEVGAIAASFGFFGIVWLDKTLSVTGRYGWLVDFVQPGVPITTSVLPLIGLEAEIIGLKDRPDRIIELPAVAVAEPGGDARKLNFTFFWNSARDGVMMLVYRSASQTELELELSKQIRARLMAEAAVTATSKELARANADLESFAAIVSHDLKAPLRHMRYLAEAAAQQIDPARNAALVSGLHAIEVQAQRMSQMLAALFEYSSLGRKYEALAPVDTLALVNSIRESCSSTGIKVVIAGDWPHLTTIQAPLDLVLRNLVGNALQHHDRANGTINVSGQDGPEALVITVADDGPGIGAEHHASIFLPFRTLEATASATSSGMGLAMVKKAVEGAGGSIAIASDPASRRGTTFTVHWPKYIVA
jgi:signal transduction histidine kinase